MIVIPIIILSFLSFFPPPIDVAIPPTSYPRFTLRTAYRPFIFQLFGIKTSHSFQPFATTSLPLLLHNTPLKIKIIPIPRASDSRLPNPTVLLALPNISHLAVSARLRLRCVSILKSRLSLSSNAMCEAEPAFAFYWRIQLSLGLWWAGFRLVDGMGTGNIWKATLGCSMYAGVFVVIRRIRGVGVFYFCPTNFGV